MNNEGKIHADIIQSTNHIKSTLSNSCDLSIRRFDVKIKKNNHRLAVLFISGLADNHKLDSLSIELNNMLLSDMSPALNSIEACYSKVKTLLLCTSRINEGNDYDTLYSQILSGNTIILFDEYDKFLVFDTDCSQGRQISEPTSQTIIRGPKEAFTESLEVNISLLRRRIKNKSLKIESMNIGSVTQTSIAILYLDKIAAPENINEVRLRLKQIKIDAVLESGYIEELIKDDPYSIFPTFLNSEKPDSVVAALLEGKIAILVDGTPFVLTVPALFIDFLQVSEDYYHDYIVATITRFFRCLSFILTLLVPAVYIALTTFHHEMIPTPMLISIAAQREGVPFPAFAEAVLMEVTFEILREAGIRMPRAIGSAISIVGALVLGQAAVEAGIISAVMVIVVSITAISSFAIPNYAMSNAIRILRFILMILSATFGLYGIYIGLIVLIFHLCKVKSIGVPYLTPIAPRVRGENKDTFIRFPLWKMNNRPSAFTKSKVRTPMTQPVQTNKSQEQELK